MLSPSHYGLPSRYLEWRSGQLESIDQIYLSPTRFVAVCAPTGFGKSLAVMAAAQMTGWRTAILTSTKGLQDQYEKDFGEIASDLRGKGNFPCPIWDELHIAPQTRVDDAPCNFGYQCPLRREGCEYFDRYRVAQASDIVVTNYQCWLHDQAREGARDGNLSTRKPFDMLVLDEAHDAPEELAAYLATELSESECSRAQIEWPREGYGQDEWVQWARHWTGNMAARVEEVESTIKSCGARGMSKEIKEAARWKKMQRKLARIAGIETGEEWVVEESAERGRGERAVRFDPLWPQRYAESELFRQVKKVILVSATVRPKTMELLGITGGLANFQEYSSSFPVARRPVIHVPTVQMRYSMSESDLEKWRNKIDNILRTRGDRKGIVHTVSYRRAKYLMEHTRYRDRMVIHEARNRQEVVERFKAAAPESGVVLVSPSVDTGYDFPDDQCRYQVIAKLPFPDLRSAVLKQRMEVDKEYRNYVTAQVLVQMCGRGVRSETDWCETLVVDDNVEWFVRQARKYLPQWFLDAYQSVNVIPQPMQIVLDKLSRQE